MDWFFYTKDSCIWWKGTQQTNLRFELSLPILLSTLYVTLSTHSVITYTHKNECAYMHVCLCISVCIYMSMLNNYFKSNLHKSNLFIFLFYSYSTICHSSRTSIIIHHETKSSIACLYLLKPLTDIFTFFSLNEE